MLYLMCRELLAPTQPLNYLRSSSINPAIMPETVASKILIVDFLILLLRFLFFSFMFPPFCISFSLTYNNIMHYCNYKVNTFEEVFVYFSTFFNLYQYKRHPARCPLFYSIFHITIITRFYSVKLTT